MPGRTCQLCQIQHQVVKGYSTKGVFEHVVIQDAAQSIYICEICRSCNCQACGRSFLAHPSAWREHLLFSSTPPAHCSMCPDCSNSAKSSVPATAPYRFRSPDAAAEFSRRVLERGTGHGSCAACLALFGGGKQAQQPAAGLSSRYHTEPLPQQQLMQQQEQQQQEYHMPGGCSQGRTTAMSWPGGPTISTRAGPAAAAAPFHCVPRHVAAQPPPSWQPSPSAPYSTTTTATTSSCSSETFQGPRLHGQQPQQQQLQGDPSAPPWTAATVAAGLQRQQPWDWPVAGAGTVPGVGAGGMDDRGLGHQAHDATVPSCGSGGTRSANLPAKGEGHALTGVGVVGRGAKQQQIKVLEGAGGVLVIESGWAE